MAKFYHELWVNKQPPLAALRSAQLTIYHHPERIPALAGERGKPDQAKTVEMKVEPRPSASAEKRTPTKLWAAFVLSGVGK
jgi:CHAT domain-containing protein